MITDVISYNWNYDSLLEAYAYEYTDSSCSSTSTDYTALTDNTGYTPKDSSECGWAVDYYYTGDTGMFFVINTNSAMDKAISAFIIALFSTQFI